MSIFRIIKTCLQSCFRWDKPRACGASHLPQAGPFLRLHRIHAATQQRAQPVRFVIRRPEARRLPDQQRPPRAVLWRDLATFRRDQLVTLQTPAGPSLAGQLQTRQDTRQLVDGKRDAMRAGFPVMASAIGDLKIFPCGLNRPAQLETSVAQAKAKLGAGIRVMAAGFAVF